MCVCMCRGGDQRCSLHVHQPWPCWWRGSLKHAPRCCAMEGCLPSLPCCTQLGPRAGRLLQKPFRCNTSAPQVHSYMSIHLFPAYEIRLQQGFPTCWTCPIQPLLVCILNNLHRLSVLVLEVTLGNSACFCNLS